jgi:hypothetical protein
MSIEWQETGGRLNHLLEQQLRSTIDLVDRIRRNAATQHVDFAHQFIAPARAEFQQRRSAFITILPTIVVKFDIGVRAHHQRSVTAASAATAPESAIHGLAAKSLSMRQGRANAVRPIPKKRDLLQAGHKPNGLSDFRVSNRR